MKKRKSGKTLERKNTKGLVDSFRFDLIFLILDPQDELFDRKLATHLVSLYYKGAEEEEQEQMVIDF